MASGVRKPSQQAEQMPANGQPANDQLKSLAKGAPSTDARNAVNTRIRGSSAQRRL